ncbi:MAG: ADP-forming succinate--CoA ligase subunit beta [Alphaproteobacteria bacterium]|nr:ADP-forming succinate--CoA ligase subunit beta [Alphaproteobacteria bacterium]
MNIYEYQAKKILSRYGIKIPEGQIAYTPHEAETIVGKISKRGPWMLKAQIYSGARNDGYFLEKKAGSGGGVRAVKNQKQVFENVAKMLDSTLVTIQTGPKGRKINRVYVENYLKAEGYFYLALAINRVNAELTLLAADIKKQDIVQIAMNKPQNILKVKLDIDGKTKPEQVKKVIDFLKLPLRSADKLESLINGLNKAFFETDAIMIELNPVGIMKNGDLVALDAKISFDDNALYRHPDIAALRDECELPEREIQAAKYKFTYNEFDGSVGCIVNGDGIVMTAMDLLREKNVGTACFINVKGGVDKDKIASGIKIIMTNPRVDGILLNILGGFLRCNLIADGIVAAASEVGLNVPMVVRFEGINKDMAKEIITNAKLPVIWADTMEEATEKLTLAIKEAS